MDYVYLPLTNDPWQVFTIDLQINGQPFHAQVEVRYMQLPDQWVISIWDHSSGELLVNQIPIICSYEMVNDLLAQFGSLRDGEGLGSMFCIRSADSPEHSDPSADNIDKFSVIWGNTYA